MFCESCCDGGDLAPGEMCRACGTVRVVTGSRPIHNPMTKDEETQRVPLTRLEALDQLTAQAQELGVYDDEQTS